MLSSAYLKNTNSLIENALAEENAGQIGIFYLDTKNETTSKIAKRVQFPIQPTKDVASEIILHQVSEKVNLRVQNQTQTKQFMRWFGDWQRHTKDVSKIQNADGSPIAPVVIDGFGFQNRIQIDSNAVTSIHGRKNAVTRLLADALDDYANGETSLFYWDKEKATTLLRRARVTMPKVSARARSGYIASIRDAGSPVKPKMKNVTESVQFKRWFGDWQRHTKDVSKIQNADGSPKIVYYKAEDAHGNIHLLDTENGGEAVYLNMRNPYRVKQKPNAQAEAQLIQYAKSEGYDGIIIPDSTSERYITFKQENIKSVDNVGTFDRGNADIRYSAKKKAANAGRLSAQAERSGRTASGEDAFKEDKYYQRQLDQWEELRDGTRIKVGIVQENSALNKVGIPAERVFYDISKIRKTMDKHGNQLSIRELKQIPALLGDPIVITEYEGAPNTVNVYGNLFTAKGAPIVVGMVVHTDIDGSTLISNIRTVHPRSNYAKQITDASVLYLNEDKKRTRTWFHVCDNLKVPLDGTMFGFIRSITYQDTKINRYSVKSRSAQSYESEIERLKKQRDEAKRQIKISKYQQVSPAGIKRMAQDLLAEYRSTANADALTDTLNKSDSFLNQTCFFNLRYTVRYMVEKLAAPPSRLEIGSARKTPLTPSPAKCGRRSVSGMTTMPFRKMEKKMA